MADISNQLISRLEKSINRLNDNLETMNAAGSSSSTNPEEAARSAAKGIDDITRAVSSNVTSLVRQLPIIGNEMAKAVEKGVGKLVGSMVGNDPSWKQKGVVGVFAAAGAALANEFAKVSKAQTELARQTGLYGTQLTNIRKITTDVYRENIKYGVSMQDAANSAASLTTALGSTSRVTKGLVTLNSVLAKYAGTSAQEMAGLTSTLVRGFQMSSREAENFTNIIANRAVSAGQNAAAIIRDLAANSSLVAMHSQRGANYIAEMAKYAGATGISLDKMQGMSDLFINMETGAVAAQKINMYTGATLNSQLLFNKALRGDTLGLFKEISSAFRSPKGIAMINEFPGAARQLAKELGLSFVELKRISEASPQQLEGLVKQREEQFRIRDAVREQYSTATLMYQEIASKVIPVISKGAEKLFEIVRDTAKFFGGGGSFNANAALGYMGTVAGVLAGGALIKFLMRGTTPESAPWVKIAPGSVMGGWHGANPIAGGGKDGKDGRRAAAGRMLGRAGGVAAVGLSAYGASQGDPAAIGTLIGTAIGGILGGIFGLGGGAVPGSILGGMLGGSAGSIYGAVASASGNVFSGPTLALVGEEGRSEVVVPTERIRKGLPVKASVAAELSSIGVPGFADGFYTPGSGGYRVDQGMYSGSGSLAETRRRQQEMNEVNRNYMRTVNEHHEELMDKIDAGNQLTREGNAILSYSDFGFGRRGGGGGGGIGQFMRDEFDRAIGSVRQGAREGYQYYKDVVATPQIRRLLGATEGLYNIVDLYTNQGRRAAMQYAGTAQEARELFSYTSASFGRFLKYVGRKEYTDEGSNYLNTRLSRGGGRLSGYSRAVGGYLGQNADDIGLGIQTGIGYLNAGVGGARAIAGGIGAFGTAMAGREGTGQYASAAYAGLGAAATGLATYGFNREGLKAGVQGGLSTGGAALLGTPAAPIGAAMLGLSMVSNEIIGDSKSKSRNDVINHIRDKVFRTGDVGSFDQSGKLKTALGQSGKGSQSRTRTYVALMSLFGKQGLNMSEARALTTYFLGSDIVKANSPLRYYFNNKLFGQTREQFEEIASKDDKYVGGTLSEFDERGGMDMNLNYYTQFGADGLSYDENFQWTNDDKMKTAQQYVNAINEDIRSRNEGVIPEGQEVELEDFVNEDGTTYDWAAMNKAAAESGFRSGMYGFHLYDEDMSQGGGPGGGQIPAELISVLNNLNATLSARSREQTIKIFMDNEQILSALAGTDG